VVTISLSLVSFAREDPGRWDHLVDAARAADLAGIDRVVVSEHVVFGEDLEEYGRPELGGHAGGRQPTGPDGHWLEPTVVLAALSSVTEHVRLATGVMLAALRRPVVLAKQLSTLDVLSGGRVDLGVGVGWQRAEYEAAGLDFGRRGRMLDHTLEVCTTLWRERVASYDAPELRFEGIHQMPKPVGPGGIPIWISGTANSAVFSRLARFGRGWILWGRAMDEPGPAIAEMRSVLAELGHPDPRGIEVSAPLHLVRTRDGHLDERAAVALADAGVTDFRGGLPPARDVDATVESFSRFVGAMRSALA
jgi:probable F420-dependent oxidoreductase